MIKRIAKTISLAMTILILSCTTTFASEENKDTVMYDGREIARDTLSVETLEWLEWYETLPEESKDMVSYEPIEITQAIRTHSTTTDTFDALDVESSEDKIAARASLLPTSGYEPVY